LIGTRLSHYIIQVKLGQGGMGVVYKAQDTRLLRSVAIKILLPHLVTDEKRRLRFIHEAQAASALNHPNICTIHDIGEENNIHFIVMEYIDGLTLREMLQKKGALPESEVIKIALQVCDALAAAHAKGIIHRDIKPENIMLTKDRRVKVMDFGLAKLKNDKNGLLDVPTKDTLLHSKEILKTSMSSYLGTASYMSPEQVEKKNLDERTDFFSLGIVLYELLTGMTPFIGHDCAAVMKSIVRDKPKSLTELESEVSHQMEFVVLKAISKQPGSRFKNASLMKEALQKSPKFEGNKQKKHWSTGSKIILYALFLVLATSILIFLNRLPFSKNTSPSPKSIRTEIIGLNNENEKWPAFSPDQKKVVYTSKKIGEAEGKAELWTKDLETGNREKIPLPDGFLGKHDLEFPDWSPDGKRIVFASSGICIVDTNGNNTKRIIDFGTYPKWSPDGKQISFSSSQNSQIEQNEIFVYNLNQ